MDSKALSTFSTDFYTSNISPVINIFIDYLHFLYDPQTRFSGKSGGKAGLHNAPLSGGL